MRLFLFFVYLIFSNPLLADYQGVLTFRTDVSVTPAPYQFFPQWTQACSVSIDAFTVQSPGTFTNRLVQLSPAQCSIVRNGTTKILSIQGYKNCSGTLTAWTGNADGTAGVLTCSGTPSCPNGQTFINGSCSSPCAQYKDQPVSFNINGSSNDASVGLTVCFSNNCQAVVTSSSSGCLAQSGCYGQATGKYTGVTCSSSDVGLSAFTNPTNANPPPVSTPEADCIKQGKTFGTVNGVVTCVNSGTPGAPPINQQSNTSTTTQTRDKDGNMTGNASTSQSQTVSQDGQTVKTTTQTKDASGSVTTQTKEQSYDQFCVENPNNKLCKASSDSKFTGSCASAFACEGDAIQCAIALQQHQIYCEAVEQNSVRDDFLNEVTANNGKRASDWIPQNVVNIPSDLSGQKLLPSSGLADMSFPILGHSLVLPLSKLNPALGFLGTIVKLFSYLFSAIIIFGRRGS